MTGGVNMVCLHTNITDCLTHWRCSDCGKTGVKRSPQERADKIGELEVQLQAIGGEQALANRLAALQYRIELKKPTG